MKKSLPIKIFSRRALETASQETKLKIAIISITDVNAPLANIQANTNIRTCIRAQFDDVYEDERNAMTAAQANFIANEIELAMNNFEIDQIWVHCEAGVARSAAVAAALAMRFYGNDEAIFANPTYYPNRHVYFTMLEALGIAISRSEWHRKINLNIKEWKKQEELDE